ncbi:MAG: RNA polymerase sigma-70 factor [Chitinophagaceae bacterium]
MGETFYITFSQDGRQYTFREIFEQYHTRLCYFASSLLPNGEDPEDVVQEAFVKLWQKKEHFPNPDTVKAFLYITVKNACLNIYKHDKIIRKYGDLLQLEEADEDNAIHHIIEAEVLENIHQALEKLPTGCRNVLHLSYFQELKNKEIAEQLHISVNTVKTQKMRGLRLIKEHLKKSAWLILPFL